MITRKQKQELIDNLSASLSEAKAAVFVDYTGLTVAQLTDLRSKLRQEGGQMKIAKKTLMDLALSSGGIAGVEVKKMPGQVAMIFGAKDEVSTAKISYKFSRLNDKLKILGGLLEKKFIDGKEVVSLAKLPAKEQLMAQVVGTIAAPLSGMVGVLQGNLRSLVYILSQINK